MEILSIFFSDFLSMSRTVFELISFFISISLNSSFEGSDKENIVVKLNLFEEFVSFFVNSLIKILESLLCRMRSMQ